MDAYSPIPLIRLSVSQAVNLCNSLLTELELIIEGEVANFSVNRGKYVFFDLKDEDEEVKMGCFMMVYQLSTPLEDGMRVVVRGKPGIYKKSGQFRVTLERAEPIGEGSIKKSYELLKRKLQAEGLFAVERKRKLPRIPEKVGLITSSQAAGFGDFILIAKNRLPGINIYLVDVSVQGESAENEIIRALDYLNSSYSMDVIVLIRGGGSPEDLHAFNSELVARAITRSKTPMLVGVGHEKDITIADYCADLRASTPSNAAQLLLPAREEIIESVNNIKHRIYLRTQQQAKLRLSQVESRIQILKRNIIFIIKNHRQLAESRLKNITALSPHHIMQRGFSLTYDQAGKIIRSKKQAIPGSSIVTRVKDGCFKSEII